MALLLALLVAYLHGTWQNPIFTVAVVFFFLFALAPFYLPTRYYLSDEEVIVRNVFTVRIPWSRWKSWRKTEGVFFLNPLASWGERARQRGLVLRVPVELEESLRSLLEEKIGPEAKTKDLS